MNTGGFNWLFVTRPDKFKNTVNVRAESQVENQGDMNKVSPGNQRLFQDSRSNPVSALFVSCLIPAYNEGANIGRVLEVVQKLSFLDEIIILDDGSSDNTLEVVRQYQKKSNTLKLLTSPANCGKTVTIQRGVNACRGDIVVMLDADLINLKPENVRTLVSAIKDDTCDLVILDRAGDRKALWGWTDCARFFGGERAFRKKDFLQIEFPAQGGFLLEIIMNLHFIRQQKKIKTIYCDNLFTLHDYNKKGFREGLKHYLKMSQEILAVSGLINFLKQIYHIEEDRLAKLYCWQSKNYLKPATFLLIPVGGFVYGWLTFLKLNCSKIAGFPIHCKCRIRD